MPDEIRVRRGELKDAVTIAAYNIHMALETEHKRLDPYTVSAGVRNALEDESKGIYFVAEAGSRVIGQLMITHEWSDWRNGDVWWIQSVYVHPDFRKQGVFKQLFAKAEDGARAAGAVMIRLYVENDNAGAQKSYENLGMTKTAYAIMEKPIERE